MKGVVIVACGHPIYGNMAFNLALTLRKQVPICVLYSGDSLSELSPEQLSFFDEKIKVPEKYYTVQRDTKVIAYQRVKVYANELTPFDTTILLDADTIWNDHDISPLFDVKQIANIGYWEGGKETEKNYTYWSDAKDMASYFDVERVYKTYGGFNCFDRNDERMVLSQMAYDDNGFEVEKWANDKPDEFAFNVGYGNSVIKSPYMPVLFPFSGHYTWYLMEQAYGYTYAGTRVDPYITTLMWKRLKMLSEKYGISYQTNLSKNILPERC